MLNHSMADGNLKSLFQSGLDSQYRTLFEFLPDSVIFKDAEGRWLDANRVACDLFEVDQAMVRGKSADAIVELSAVYRSATSDCENTDALAWEYGRYRFEQHIFKHGEHRVYDVIKVAIYNPESVRNGILVIGRDITDRHQVERAAREAQALRDALNRGEFVMYHQPKVDGQTGMLVGMEALIRWVHPQSGVLRPNAFIPLAEDAGLITILGEQVMRLTCLQAAAWASLNFGPFQMSFNVSVGHLLSEGFREGFLRILQETNANPRWLQVEITESLFMHAEQATETLEWLKALGVTIAIDDFGTGFSSLSYLQKLPIDQLKIDGSFIQNLPDSIHDQTIVKAIIDLAHNLGIGVVAEGVEQELQRKALQGLGCDHMQGFLFGQPVSAAVFEQAYLISARQA